jgi:putative glutamine amidotransferase
MKAGEDRRRPVIGVVTYGRASDPARYGLPVPYVSAVTRAGGRVVMLPPGDEPADTVLDGVDGLMLAGGGDVDPARYGGPPHPELYGVDPTRDALELALAGEALERRVPTLAICRGLQVVNVALGGDLVPHLPDRAGRGVAHRAGIGLTAEHGVRLAAGSRLAAICGATTLRVASSHHQAPGRLGRGLAAVAWADDDTVEALEAAAHPELVAVLWHPEETAGRDPAQHRLFEWLVERARLRLRPGP